MLYDVIKTSRGKEHVAFTGERAKALGYAKRLRDSQRKGVRGSRTSYRVVPSDSTAKFKEKPHYPNGRDH